jgi:hypothetical protein
VIAAGDLLTAERRESLTRRYRFSIINEISDRSVAGSTSSMVFYAQSQRIGLIDLRNLASRALQNRAGGYA